MTYAKLQFVCPCGGVILHDEVQVYPDKNLVFVGTCNSCRKACKTDVAISELKYEAKRLRTQEFDQKFMTDLHIELPEAADGAD